MKKGFTLIILFACLKLSATVPYFYKFKPLPLNHPADTTKLSPDSSKSKTRVNPKDSLKHATSGFKKDSAKITPAAIHADSIRQTLVVSKNDSTKALAAVNYADSIKQVSSILKKDSVVVSALVNHADSIKQVITIVKKDSAGILTSANQQDNIKPANLSSKKDSTNLLISVKQADNQMVSAAITQKDNLGSAPLDHTDNLPEVNSLIQLDSLRMSVIAEQNRQAELRRVILRNEQIKLAGVLKINNLDSLKQQLKVSASDTVKALIYTRIALKYLDYDTISNNQKRLYYQNQAINYTLQAIRQYSIYNDSTALRISFDHLAKVYASQQKYSQAKWFILQSNTLSRAKNDTPNIISSLLTLATIKSDINDNDLAMRDLDEALQLSITTRSPKTETEILKNYALLYSKLQNYPKEAMVLKKRDSLLDSIRKSDEAQLAKAALRAKTDSLQNKKKVFSSNIRKLYKNSSSRKIASL